MKTRFLNEGKMLLFTAALGAAAGAVVWIFLKLVSVFTGLLWVALPGKVSVAFLPVMICAAGGLLIGLVHKFFGNYPEELPVVMGKIKKNKHYDYKNMLPILVAAFLPLIFGGSVGPEAGLTGVIAGLCYWVGDNVKFAGERKREYTEVGEAVTLGVIFHAPLFGIFAVEEDNITADVSKIKMSRATKFLLYGISAVSAMLIFYILGQIFGKASAGFPSFSDITLKWQDYLLMVLYIPVGTLLCLFFALCEGLTERAADKLPVIIKEVIGGIIIGLIGMAVPMVLFSGEEELARLGESFAGYAPLFLIGICLLKIFLTAFSIRFGFRGGHFFPLIFACSCMGFGLAMVFFRSSDIGHMVFAAGCVTAATLGAQIRKPFAVTMLALICFPVKMVLFLFLSAVIGRWITGILRTDRRDRNGNGYEDQKE